MSYISFSDPDRLIGFPIVNENTTERLLTGGDIDPESLQVDRHGDLWVGDEFGPWILHFDAEGRLLEAPIPMPGDLMSPNNPHLPAGHAATQPNSRGLRGHGHRRPVPVPDPGGRHGGRRPTGFDSPADVRVRHQQGRVHGTAVGVPGRDPSTPFVSDVAPLDNKRLVVIERDGVNPGVQRAGVRRRFAPRRDWRGAREAHGARPRSDPGSGPRVPAADPCGRHRSRQPVPGGLRVGRGNPGDRPGAGPRRLRQQLPEHGRNPSLADDNEFIVVDVPGLSDRH